MTLGNTVFRAATCDNKWMMSSSSTVQPCPAGCECEKHHKNGRKDGGPIFCLNCGKITTNPRFCDRVCSNNYSWSENGPRFGQKKKKTGRGNAEMVLKRVPVICLYCQAVTMRSLSKADSKFCNKECYNNAQRNGVLKAAKKCQPGCACKKHDAGHGRTKDKVASSPCLNCGKVHMVHPCHGSGTRAEKKFCNRNCLREFQQKRMAERRATGDARKYDMKPEEYQARLVAQNGRCAICLKSIFEKEAHRDHCHVTGQWRGLLCSNCNLGLGNLQDDPDTVLRAWQYLVMGGVAPLAAQTT